MFLQDDIVRSLGKMSVKGLTPTTTKIVFTEDEVKQSCGETCLNQSRAMGILCKKGQTSLQFYHKTGQEHCAGIHLSSQPKRLASYLKDVNTLEEALSVAPVLRFASTSKQAAKAILRKLLQIFNSQPIRDYYRERLTLDETFLIQRLIILCLDCNFEAAAEAEFASMLANLFSDGEVLFHGIPSNAAIALAYYMRHCNPQDISHVTLRPIAHSSQPFIQYGPTHNMHNQNISAIKSIPDEQIQQISENFKAANPDLNVELDEYTPSVLASYIPCIQACEGLPSSSETHLQPLINSFKYIKLKSLDINYFPLGDTFDLILDSLENGEMQSLLDLSAQSALSRADQLTRLVTHLPQMPSLQVIDISDNAGEDGQSIPILANNLASCKALSTLYVDNVHAPADDMLILAQNLPSQLAHLAIDRNEMNDAVASCLIHTLPCTLTFLGISVSDMSTDIHNELLSSIQSRLTHLQWLRVWDSPYSADLVRHAGLALTTCSDLKNLQLHTTCRSVIPRDCLDVFMNGLHHAEHINKLYMYGIQLCRNGFEELVDLCRQKQMQELR